MRRGFKSEQAAHDAAAAAFRQLSQAGRSPFGWAAERVKGGSGWFARVGCKRGQVEVWPAPASGEPPEVPPDA